MWPSGCSHKAGSSWASAAVLDWVLGASRFLRRAAQSGTFFTRTQIKEDGCLCATM